MRNVIMKQLFSMIVNESGMMSRENAKPRPVENGTAGLLGLWDCRYLMSAFRQDGLDEFQGDGEPLESGGDVELATVIAEQGLAVMFFFVPFWTSSL